MAYMNQDKKAVIKTNLDKVLKPLGIKYSLRVKDYMSITCTLRSGAVDFIGNTKTVTNNKFHLHNNRGYIQVNQFWYDEHFTGLAREIIGKTVDALKSADYYDRSDAQIDYFDTAYYIHLNVGSWDKPYELKGTK
jgi:hypothetical protein